MTHQNRLDAAVGRPRLTVLALVAALLAPGSLWAQDAPAAESPPAEASPADTPDTAEGAVEDAAEGAAADEDDEAIEEILVTTARKRRESVIDTPAALTVMDGDMLQGLNVSNLDDVGKYVPNLNITRFGVGNTSQAAVFIRGIGLQDHLITTDPGVGVYLDGVYLGRQMGNNLALDNIDRLEVLRGPQGTLYGRNTIGGAVNIVTRKPGDEEGTRVRFELGTLGRFGASMYSNYPITDRLAMSVTGAFSHRDGVGEAINLANPEAEIGEINQFFGRAAVQWEPADSVRVLVTADASAARNGQSPSTIEIIGPPDDFAGIDPIQPSEIPDAEDSATTVAGLESTSNDSRGASLTIEWDLAEGWTTRLLASYRASEYTGGLDDDITARNLSEFPEQGEADQRSAELQLNGEVGPIELVAGVYYFDEKGSNFSGPFTFAPFNNGDLEAGDFFELEQTTTAYAGYANASYRIIESLSIGAGVRYSKDAKEAEALFPSFGGQRETREADFDAITWDANATFSPADNMSVYAQVQRGYQTGGFPPRPFGGAAQFNTFDEITATNYEVGFKGIVHETTALFVSAFLTQYDDLALPFSQPAAEGFVTIVENAGSSQALGVEFEGRLRVGGFHLIPAVGFIQAEITRVDEGTIGIEKGASPALTPSLTLGVNTGYTHVFDGGDALRLQADFSHRGEQYGQSVESESELMAARNLVGFSLGFTHARNNWDLELYGENVLDEVYDQGRLNNTFHGFVGIVQSNDRREFGLRFTKSFGDL